jgi:four helix bundle protein
MGTIGTFSRGNGSLMVQMAHNKSEGGRVKSEKGQPQRRDLPERTFEFARRIVKLCQQLDQTPGVSRTLANQLLRSGTSIGANVEEGQGGQSRADFVAKYSISCKEARETHYWLRLLAATEIVSFENMKDLIDEANQIVAILITIIKKCKTNK